MNSAPLSAEKADAIKQIQNLRIECDNLLADIKGFSPPDANGHYHPTFRLIATPMLYSIWQRCFSLCHAITLRLIRDITPTPAALNARRRATWLIRAEFYRSYVDRLKADTSKKKNIKKGEFNLLTEFLENFDSWTIAKIDPAVDTEKLVMTFSNVNPDVVEINAKAIGLWDYPPFRKLKLGKLHDLVGQRNEIGHGGLISPPANEHFIELMNFTELMVKDYSDIFIAWIQVEF